MYLTSKLIADSVRHWIHVGMKQFPQLEPYVKYNYVKDIKTSHVSKDKYLDYQSFLSYYCTHIVLQLGKISWVQVWAAVPMLSSSLQRSSSCFFRFWASFSSADRSVQIQNGGKVIRRKGRETEERQRLKCLLRQDGSNYTAVQL